MTTEQSSITIECAGRNDKRANQRKVMVENDGRCAVGHNLFIKLEDKDAIQDKPTGEKKGNSTTKTGACRWAGL